MNNEDLIKCNTGLICKVANKFYGAEFDDLFQAGALGLIKAYKNYHENGTTKFSTYAYDYIYGEMYQLVNNKTIKINKDILKLYRLVEKTRSALCQKNNRMPLNSEIAQFLELPESTINEAIMAGKEIMSLDSEKEDDMNLYDTLAKDETINIDDRIMLSQSMQVLSDDEKKIIKARYYEDLTQSEVAKKLSMTQVMVSRYEKRSLNKMQEFMCQ